MLLMPSALACITLRIFGHRVGKGCRFGFSLIFADRILMQQRAVIGHFNFININRLVMRDGSSFGRMNIVNGPVSVVLGQRAAIGNTNKILRAGPLRVVTTGCAILKLGELTKITSNHHVDCTKSVRIGKFSIIAGVGSQIWTHGYIHDTQGPGRFRIDGKVDIGNNVSIGAGCVISMGVKIVAGVIVGAGVSVARNLLEPGLYVSAPVRQLPRPDAPDRRADLDRVTDSRLCELVYVKIRENR
jgi:acetyltransferase-like isoleucine patch superfamily enzyme